MVYRIKFSVDDTSYDLLAMEQYKTRQSVPKVAAKWINEAHHEYGLRAIMCIGARFPKLFYCPSTAHRITVQLLDENVVKEIHSIAEEIKIPISTILHSIVREMAVKKDNKETLALQKIS